MGKQICIKCGKESDVNLPLCSSCRESVAEFHKLVEYLNSFTGRKEDLLWIIGSELSSRESSIISQARVENDFVNGTIVMIPIEPGSQTTKVKPWLKRRYHHIKDTIDEISKLRRALGIAKRYYGVA
jgi:hypothetical protein